MNVQFNPILNLNKQADTAVQNTKESSNSFSDVLSQALKQVETDLKSSEEMSKLASIGEAKDLHQVMIAMEKADLSLQLAVQVRNKVVEAYQEMMRMQI